MSNGSREEWLPVEEAAAILHVTVRQVNRYGQGDEPKLRTRKAGQRTLYYRHDVEQFARERGAEYVPETEPKQPGAELMPPGEMFDLIREMQDRLMAASRRVGELEGLLQMRLLPEDAEELRRRLAVAEAERDVLKREVEQRRKPWWKRLLGND
jgi:hypothetical protein